MKPDPISATGRHSPAEERIIAALTGLLRQPIRRVTFAGGVTPPPAMAFLVHFPRLAVTLSGTDHMELETNGKRGFVKMTKGEALFVPPNCWNRPTWSQPVRSLNFLFGPKQIGLSLVEQRGRQHEPAGAIKIGFRHAPGGPTSNILNALLSLATESDRDPEAGLLVTVLLHQCLRLLQTPLAIKERKAQSTYEQICLYVQENFQLSINRESVAHHFKINPHHVSRLFRTEGLMRFTDYLNWVRLARAKFLLKHHHQGLDEIAASCGFNHTGYFCRQFKRRFRMTPGEYRQRSAAA